MFRIQIRRVTPLHNLVLLINEESVSSFFTTALQDELRRTRYNPVELLYVGDVLSKYAFTMFESGRPVNATVSEETVPSAFTRTELTPHLYTALSPEEGCENFEGLEAKASWIFFMTSFFRSYTDRKNNVALYDHIAQGYYYRASLHTNSEVVSDFLKKFIPRVPFWARTCDRVRESLSWESRAIRIS